jgi:ketosteroid isomerase-like protein
MPSTFRIHRLLCMALAAVAGCASAPRPDHSQLVAQVTAAEVAFAKTMADRDHAGFLAFVAEDAVFIGGNKPTRGRAAVGEAWKRLYAAPVAPFSWKPELVEVNGAGTLALSTGPVSTPDGKVISHYYSTWRRDADGRWRVVFDNGYDVCDCATKGGQ